MSDGASTPRATGASTTSGERLVGRRSFLGMASVLAVTAALGLTGCDRGPKDAPDEGAPAPGATPGAVDALATAATLPAPDPDPDSPFGVDRAINMATIDDYLGLPGVTYRDMRMLLDPAQYEEIGGHANLEMTLEGFRIVPFPYVGTLQELPVSGAYQGERLFDVAWNDDGTVAGAVPRFAQSHQILEDLFPKDGPVFLMCGAGGYAGMTRQLLIYLGWDADKLYNVGGQWDYVGDHPVQLIAYDERGDAEYLFWRADYASIDFDDLTPVDS
ncbi:MAG: twin-arginine translocation signal domain-containing protein [Eggerthellaceae bacterium]|nr:twin-arginine translocation signal domain-containing protein [Eggerthellaceae bacterium]